MDRWRIAARNGQSGQFKRADSVFRDRITADGSSGFKAEPGRYHLYVAHGCPWAHRTLIYRAIKKLDGFISVAYSIPGLKTERLDLRARPALSGLHSRRGQRLPLSLRSLCREQSDLYRQGHGADIVGQEDEKDRQQRVLRNHPDAQHRVQRHHRRSHRPLSAGFARRDRRGQRARLSQRQQRRVSRRLRQVASRLRGSL